MKNIPIDKQAHFLAGVAIASTVTLKARITALEAV